MTIFLLFNLLINNLYILYFFQLSFFFCLYFLYNFCEKLIKVKLTLAFDFFCFQRTVRCTWASKCLAIPALNAVSSTKCGATIWSTSASRRSSSVPCVRSRLLRRLSCTPTKPSNTSKSRRPTIETADWRKMVPATGVNPIVPQFLLQIVNAEGLSSNSNYSL